MNNRDRCAVINTHQTHELNSEYIDRRNETNAAKAMHLLPSHQIRGRRVTLANEYLSHQPISPSNAPRYFANFSTLTYSILVMYCKKKIEKYSIDNLNSVHFHSITITRQFDNECFLLQLRSILYTADVCRQWVCGCKCAVCFVFFLCLLGRIVD